ncbi:MAG: hypothetical protein KAJ81_07380 [Candidatus Latescibacteria bacterium]|nr:hypothetical protein [Candidatus Latescibacterota bacterium]MCK5327171.1 hypothetical protein [Candidatus Latescibacterota bacterium]MCK5381277.1 hypothetical protein [Candidatus Latescibacterota bacterium]MCK5733551.1 hypothetical protein [Candidatus Latescibacterota bacterium]
MVFEMMKWIHWIEAIVGAVILFAGLYLSFWTGRAKGVLKELSDLPEDDLAFVGSIVGPIGFILIYIGIRRFFR